MEFIKDVLFVLTHPSYWLMSYPYSKEFDHQIMRLAESNQFTRITEHTANLGRLTIWTGNHPYASFRHYELKVRPSRRHIEYLHNKLIRESTS